MSDEHTLIVKAGKAYYDHMALEAAIKPDKKAIDKAYSARGEALRELYVAYQKANEGVKPEKSPEKIRDELNTLLSAYAIGENLPLPEDSKFYHDPTKTREYLKGFADRGGERSR